MHFCRDFKLFKFTLFFPPLDLVKFHPSLPFPPFETHVNPLSSTDQHIKINEEEKFTSVSRNFALQDMTDTSNNIIVLKKKN